MAGKLTLSPGSLSDMLLALHLKQCYTDYETAMWRLETGWEDDDEDKEKEDKKAESLEDKMARLRHTALTARSILLKFDKEVKRREVLGTYQYTS